MTDITKKDDYSEKKYKLNNFNPQRETVKFSYTSGRVLNAVYNTYEKNEFSVFGYYSDWSQYDGRYENDFDDDKCGRGIDLMRLDPHSLDKIIIGFCAIVGDNGTKKSTIDRAANDFQRRLNQMTFTDSWGDVLSYRNCGFGGWVTNDVLPMFNENSAQGVLGGLRILKKKNPNLIVSLSIGGWTMSEAYHGLVADASKRQTFCDSVVDVFERFPMFTEIDLDWEYPNAPGDVNNKWDETDAENYPKLIKDLKIAFAAANRSDVKISIAVSADPVKMKAAYLTNMLKAGIYGINLMSYDFFGTPWATELAHHTNIYSTGANNGWSLDTAIGVLREINFPLKQVFVGFAGYSRNAKNAEITSFSPLRGKYDPKIGTTSGTFESGATESYDLLVNYLDLDNQIGRNGFDLYTDKKANADYLYNSQSKLFMSIETPRTAREKGMYVKEHGLGGMFIWTIDYDAGLLINAAREGLGCQLINKKIDMSKYYFEGNNQKPPVSALITGPNRVMRGQEAVFSGSESESSVGQIVSYAWEVPQGISFDANNKATLRLTAPWVNQTTNLSIALTIIDSNGNRAHTAHTFRVVTREEPVYPVWNMGSVYTTGDRVSWLDDNWEAMWWSQNDEPGQSLDGAGAGPNPWRKID